MKITSIRVTHVNVPFDAPFWWTAGLSGEPGPLHTFAAQLMRAMS